MGMTLTRELYSPITCCNVAILYLIISASVIVRGLCTRPGLYSLCTVSVTAHLPHAAWSFTQHVQTYLCYLLLTCVCLKKGLAWNMRKQWLTDCDSEGNPASVSQCLMVSGNSCESLLRVCHRVYVEKLRPACVCVCVGAIKKLVLLKCCFDRYQ